jgi:hypothetical protein
MFEVPGQQDGARPIDDVALLASRRRALEDVSTNKSSPSNFTINLAGISDLLGPRIGNDAAPGPPRIAPTTLPRKIDLDDWCQMYELSNTIQYKLRALDITGPHALRFVTDEDLRSVGNLSLGELADVRDGQERWSKAADAAA